MTEQKKHCYCPYCEEELQSADSAYCQACHVTLNYCPECKTPVPREQTRCSVCGCEVKVLK